MRKNHNRGTYNATKTKVLVYLAEKKDSGDQRPIGLAALVKATGANYGYLKTRLRVWSRWGYLHCHTLIPEKGRPFYGYSLARDGRGFVEHLNRPYRVRGYRKPVSLEEEASTPSFGERLLSMERDRFLAPAGGHDNDDDGDGEDTIDMDEIFGEG